MEEEKILPCDEKLRFMTKREASAAGVVAKHQHGIELKPYHCQHCGWWHLSSS